MAVSDQSQFKELFDSYYEALCNYAKAWVKDAHIAEDLVQTLFMQLWEKQPFKEINPIENYLVKSLKYKCIDYLRSHNKYKTEALDPTLQLPTNQEEFTDEDILPLLHFYAALLPPKTRQVFLLSREKGMRYQDIADDLDISIKTVENQMSRALKILRKLVKNKDLYLIIISTYF
ncbi:MAG: RNA polymerase sigma-70 factor [Bacteroidota bacterium]